MDLRNNSTLVKTRGADSKLTYVVIKDRRGGRDPQPCDDGYGSQRSRLDRNRSARADAREARHALLAQDIVIVPGRPRRTFDLALGVVDLALALDKGVPIAIAWAAMRWADERYDDVLCPGMTTLIVSPGTSI